MPSTSVAVHGKAPSADNPVSKADKARPITRKVREAIEAMVWLGLPRAGAAAKAGLSEHGLYKALRSPPVKAAYLAECEVLRTSGRARRIHRLEEMQEQNDNKAAVVNAILALEGMGHDQATANAQQSAIPGVVIQIITQAPMQTVTDARLTQAPIASAEMKVITA